MTLAAARKYCPSAEETTMGTMSQTRQNLRSTKPQLTTSRQVSTDVNIHKPGNNASSSCQGNNNASLKDNSDPPCEEAFIFIRHSSKMYSDQTGKFPYVARSGNQYLMTCYVVDVNLILATAFKN